MYLSLKRLFEVEVPIEYCLIFFLVKLVFLSGTVKLFTAPYSLSLHHIHYVYILYYTIYM